MSSWAVPGQKVVCVDDGPDWLGRPVNLVSGDIYTIEMLIGPLPSWLYPNIPGVILVEQEASSPSGFMLSRFRPLTKSTKTQEEDIALFWDIMAEEGEKV